ncbi:SRPBCC family protein [Methylomonas sp. SURF-1]|uniref:SRPBCC family protein n=1 Tax=Methylomonas aurea TaxID=2952224 RepID=A0ABT1UDF9_9GAMM|nr:SRPBCC family protein [Methylomonas sp. SURF-1]MCQ8180190.1 SRPBCC family protein [Methylomonas sp. SURF-1]
MKVYYLYRKQALALSAGQAWEFFSSPHHLNRITPDFFHIDITSPVPDAIYGGLLIRYRMKAVGGWPMVWLSEISHCDKPRRFVYQQRVGPFAFWSHEVAISESANGVEVEDIVFYAMPFGWFGRLMHRWLIGKKLRQIFDTRRDYLERHWGIAAGDPH